MEQERGAFKVIRQMTSGAVKNAIRSGNLCVCNEVKPVAGILDIRRFLLNNWSVCR
jgi:hypothetical protein